MRYTPITALLASSVLLSACGGGGTSVTVSPSGAGGVVAPPTSPEAARPVIQSSALGEIAEVDVTFGSVHVSSAELTGSSTEFSNDRLVTTISRAGDAADIVLDSANSQSNYPATSSELNLPGQRKEQIFDIFSYTSSTATMATVGVDWDENNPADYLAGGYWLHFEADASLVTLELGAYVAGPELDSANQPTMPTTGTATYSGVAEGAYIASFGSDAATFQETEGAGEIGEFSGVAQLDADFANGTIGGCVGCNGVIAIEGYAVAPNGATTPFTGTTDLQLKLVSTSYNSDGTFEGTMQLVAPAELGVTFDSHNGAWGGQFSTTLSGGEPRLVAGVAAGSSTTSGGSKVAYLGIFGAGKQ